MDTDRTIVITERGDSFVEMTGHQASELQALGFCSVMPTTTSGRWRVNDVTRVGVVHVSGLQIAVEPKTPVESLLFMASYAGTQIELGTATTVALAHTDLPTAIADAFRRVVAEAVARGLVKGYVPTEESATVIRGRWDIARQWRIRPGIPLPAEVTYDDFTEDVLENRILNTAMHALTRVPTLDAGVRRSITDTQLLFRDVGLLPPGKQVPRVVLTRSNMHYAAALRIAEWILESFSWAHRKGASSAGTFLVNVAVLFERFVAEVFRAALAPAGVAVESQLTEWTLDREGQVKLRPDLVLSRDTVLTVADTKYKVWGQSNSSPPNADVYQALAYALRAGVPTSHLLYVSGDVAPRAFTIDSAGVRVVAHALDIGGGPEDVLERTAALARRLIQTSAAPIIGLSAERAS